MPTSGLLTLALALVWAFPPPATARQVSGGPASNLTLFDSLAVSCLETVTMAPSAWVLQIDPGAAFFRPALLGHLRDRDVKVFLDHPVADSLQTLRVSLDGVRVVYHFAGRRRVKRELALSLRFLQQEADGRALREDACHRTLTDFIPERSLDSVESAAVPASQGQRPPAGFRRRWLEPALLTTALGTIVYLFFAIRSRSGD